jgi:hypothetical protein
MAGDLPGLLRKRIEDFPLRCAYLHPDETRGLYWRSYVDALGSGLKVGICWRSGLNAGERSREYSSLSDWAAIFSIPNVILINLQYGECEDELACAEARFGVQIHRPAGINLFNDLDDLSALASCLDLVISAGTAVLALCGAVGVPVCKLDSLKPAWDLLGTDYSPWFPCCRVYKQPVWNDWQTPLTSIAEDIRKLASPSPAVIHGSIRLGYDDGSPAESLVASGRTWLSEERKLVVQALQPGHVALDIYARTGHFALDMAKAVGVNGHVFAFEPNQARFRVLTANGMLQSLPQLHAHRGLPDGYSFPRIDKLELEKLSWIHIDTIDAPWAWQMVMGAEKTLGRLHPSILFTGLAECPAELAQMLALLGYQVQRLDFPTDAPNGHFFNRRLISMLFLNKSHLNSPL